MGLRSGYFLLGILFYPDSCELPDVTLCGRSHEIKSSWDFKDLPEYDVHYQLLEGIQLSFRNGSVGCYVLTVGIGEPSFVARIRIVPIFWEDS